MTGHETKNAMGAAGGGHVVENQQEVLAFLSLPAAYGTNLSVDRFDTHGAVVFLVGNDAYKVKRAVRFPFMDLSTLARREAACLAEVEVNRVNAPELYLGTVPITREPGGSLALGGNGPAVEWAVHMRRFDQADMLDQVAQRGGLSAAMVARLASSVLAAHRRAPIREGAPAADSLRRYVTQNQEAFGENPALFPADRVAALTRDTAAALATVRDLLLARGDAGHVRQCHGDLHLRNIVLWKGEPTLFDAIEFDPAIATGDVLYDLAFLVMDLWERGLRDVANIMLNRYLADAGDEAHLSALVALPVFLSIRAAIRAKVTAATLPHLHGAAAQKAAGEARRYFELAQLFLTPESPALIAAGGLSGTGKSVLSASLAPLVGAPPGAIHLRSDVERKRLFGVDDTVKLPADAYTEEVGRRVYALLAHKASLVLAAGRSVVVDAVFSQPWQRDAVAQAAAQAGVPLVGLWLEAPEAVLVARVAGRQGDASDADEAVVRRQAEHHPGADGWLRVDASGLPADTLARARAALPPGLDTSSA